MDKIRECDRNYDCATLKQMYKEKGLSTSGCKAELCAKLIAHGDLP